MVPISPNVGTISYQRQVEMSKTNQSQADSPESPGPIQAALLQHLKEVIDIPLGSLAASTTKVLHWTRTGEQRIFVCPTLGQKWGKEAIMKMSRRTNQEQKSIDRIECGPEKSMRHRLRKQRARLLRLREDLSKEIQQLTTDSKFRNLGLNSSDLCQCVRQ